MVASPTFIPITGQEISRFLIKWISLDFLQIFVLTPHKRWKNISFFPKLYSIVGIIFFKIFSTLVPKGYKIRSRLSQTSQHTVNRLGVNLSLEDPSVFIYHPISVIPPILNEPNKLTSKLLEEAMRRYFQKMPHWRLQEDAFVSLEPLLIFD